MNRSELNSTVKVGHLNGRYSYRSIGAVRVRATHADADRDEGDEQDRAKNRKTKTVKSWLQKVDLLTEACCPAASPMRTPAVVTAPISARRCGFDALVRCWSGSCQM
jgi:hypothetical protein